MRDHWQPLVCKWLLTSFPPSPGSARFDLDSRLAGGNQSVIGVPVIGAVLGGMLQSPNMVAPSDPATIGDVVLIGANATVVCGEDQPEHRGGGKASVRFFGFRRLCPQVRAIGNGSELVACDPKPPFAVPLADQNRRQF